MKWTLITLILMLLAGAIGYDFGLREPRSPTFSESVFHANKAFIDRRSPHK